MNKRSGQSLVSLMIFTAIAIVVTSAAVTVVLLNSQGTSNYSLGEELFALGEGSGLENATLRLLRDPNFTSSTVTLNSLTPPVFVTISVSGAGTKTITISSEVDGVVRKFQATGSFTGTVFTLSSWQEIQ